MFKKKEKKQKKSSDKLGSMKILSGLLFAKMAKGGASQLRSNADEVNKLNVFPVPDGDTGDNMRMTIESGINALENIDSDDLSEVMRVLSHGMLLGARGNSGVILSQFFAGTAKGLESAVEADPATLGAALEMGVKQAYSSVMTPTEGTVLTVARESVEYAVSQITPQSTIRTFFADLVKEMHESLDRTPDILPVLKEAGVVDSGGAGLFYIIDGFNKVLNGEEITITDLVADPQLAPPKDFSGFGPDSEMEYGYCTELLVQLQNKKTNIDDFDVEALKKFLAGLGDSIVAFKTDSIVKIHVHTLTPEKVLAYCRKYGEFLTVKIENMSVQHTSISEKAEEEKSENGGIAVETADASADNLQAAAAENHESSESKTKEPPVITKKYGVVAVCNGPGIEALFKDLGTDAVVQGGQTQNPSTNDFLDAFMEVPAEHIFVFPNNGNILMAAQQAASIYEHSQIHVIPSKNIGTGYAALSTINYEEDNVEAVIAALTETMNGVTAGYISPSIRDADINGIHIKKGDTIGIIDKEIVVSKSDRNKAAHALAAKILGLPGKFMLTVFCGKDATAEERSALDQYLTEHYPTFEIYFIDGGQDIYPYIFVAE